MKKIQIEKVNVNIIKKCGIILLLSVILGGCSLVLTALPCDLNLIKILVSDKYILLMNIWPLFVTMLLIFFITNRVWLSFLSVGTITFIIAEVNRFKMTFRDDPFVFADVLLFNEAKNMMGKYSLFLDKVSFLAITFIITTIVCVLLIKKESFKTFVRAVCIIIITMFMIITINMFYFQDSSIYNRTWHSEFGNQWKYGNQYMSRGVVYSFIRSIPDAIILPPEGYDEQEVVEELGKYETVDMEEEKKVHIISIMLEAYNDFSQFENVEFVVDPYKNYHEIQNNSYHGNLFTNIFAAGTILTERSFLTGYNDSELSNKTVESFVRYFNSQGYYTVAMHPCYGWFYNRKNINENLGFQNFEYYENTYADIAENEVERDLYHGLLSDYDFFDYIIDGYEDTVREEKKYFNFSVTYQNHGPYSNEKETETEFLLRKDEYTEAEYNIINNYFDGIAKTDEALKKLCDYIDEQNEPIVLILFGDHNPLLGDNNSGYTMLGIDLSLDSAEGASNYYQTPYIFYANEAAKSNLGKSFKEQGNTISPMFLMNELFEYMEMEGPSYLNYLQALKKQYSVINTVYVKKDNEYILKSEDEENRLLIQHENIEYYMKNNKVTN